jgi:transcriptional regulator with XRE-family HTH domain
MEAPNLTDRPPASPPAADDNRLISYVGRGIRVELARRARSMSDLARALDVTPPTLSRKLAGVQPMTLDDIDRIAEQLGISGVGLIRLALEVAP